MVSEAMVMEIKRTWGHGDGDWPHGDGRCRRRARPWDPTHGVMYWGDAADWAALP